jgi:hypothetical protein
MQRKQKNQVMLRASRHLFKIKDKSHSFLGMRKENGLMSRWEGSPFKIYVRCAPVRLM